MQACFSNSSSHFSDIYSLTIFWGHNLYSHHRHLQPLFQTPINPLTNIFKIYVKDATHHHCHDNSDNPCVPYSNVSYYTAVNISFVTYKGRSGIYIFEEARVQFIFSIWMQITPFISFLFSKQRINNCHNWILRFSFKMKIFIISYQ